MGRASKKEMQDSKLPEKVGSLSLPPPVYTPVEPRLATKRINASRPRSSSYLDYCPPNILMYTLLHLRYRWKPCRACPHAAALSAAPRALLQVEYAADEVLLLPTDGQVPGFKYVLQVFDGLGLQPQPAVV